MNPEDISEQQRAYEREIRRRSLNSSAGSKHVLVDLTILRADAENVIADMERVLAGGNGAVFEDARKEISFAREQIANLEQFEAYARRAAGALIAIDGQAAECAK